MSTPQQRRAAARREENRVRAQQSSAEARKAEADAVARKAEAEARAIEVKAKADAEARKAEAAERQAAIDAKAKKDADDAARAPYERGYQVAVNLAMPVAGVYVGHKIAKKIEARHVTSMSAANAQLTKVAAEVPKNLTKAQGRGKPADVAKVKLAASVSAADKLKLGRTRGPLGLATAALLLGEGMLSRFVVAPQIENKEAKEALNVVATASVFAATTLVGDRVLQNATPKVLPAAKDVAAIEAARKVTGASPAPSSVGKTVAKVAKIAIPVIAAAAAVSAFARASKAGDSTADAAGKAAAAGGDVILGGGVSTFTERREKGDSVVVAGLRAAATTADSYVLFGLGQAAINLQRSRSAKPELDASIASPPAGPSGSTQAAAPMAYISAAAEAKAEKSEPALPVIVPSTKSAGAGKSRSDGMTQGYTRRNGTIVSGYRTPTR
ncbi:hypothetical protein ACO2I3_12320 [Leptospira interrogans]